MTALVWCECRGHWPVIDRAGLTVDELLRWAIAYCRRKQGCRCPEHRIGPPEPSRWPAQPEGHPVERLGRAVQRDAAAKDPS